MPLLALIAQIASIAQSIFPLFAMAHKAADPTASNAALSNASQVITAAQGLVAIGEQAAAGIVATGGVSPTGAQKLAVVQAAVQQAHSLVAANGGTTVAFDQVWNPLNDAITQICAASKVIDALDRPMVS